MSNKKDISDKAVERPQYDSAPKRDFLEGFLSQPDTPESAPTPSDVPLDSEINDHFPDVSERVVEALKTIYDPEIPVNIYELGLIYNVWVDEDRLAHIIMTLTTPHCPVAESMPGEVEQLASSVEGVLEAKVSLVWEPPWDPSKMSEAAQLELGFI